MITEYEGWNLNLNVSIKTTVLTLFGMGDGEEDFSPELLLWLFFGGLIISSPSDKNGGPDSKR